MLFVCHSHVLVSNVLVCHPYVIRLWFYKCLAKYTFGKCPSTTESYVRKSFTVWYILQTYPGKSTISVAEMHCRM